ncbi:uncharacterized protein [Paramormyrops kingsleyae]|uniref:uncharacterized protein n=1 Tax=Paramormyrops kingsleyae TaxID=1676925 RepID=UPI003B975674
MKVRRKTFRIRLRDRMRDNPMTHWDNQIHHACQVGLQHHQISASALMTLQCSHISRPSPPHQWGTGGAAFKPADMNTLERKLEKRSKKDSEDGAIVRKRIRIAKRPLEDKDDSPTAMATVSGTKDKTAAIQNQGAGILASISSEEHAENSGNELSLVRQELMEIKKFIFTEIPQIKEMLRSSMHLGSPESLPSPSTPVQTEEIVPGPGVYVSRNVWRSACQASSGTSMARILLLGVFDIETLVKSNLRGGESKVSKGGDGERRSALDEVKVRAIMDAVMSKHSVSAGQVGTALNGKMAELRLAMSKKNVN